MKMLADGQQARKLNVPIYHLLGGKVRNKIRVYAWIGGDRPDEVEAQAYVMRFRFRFKRVCAHAH